METVSIKKQNVQKAFKEGCDDVRKVLKNLFGEDVLSASNWIEVWENFSRENKLKIVLPYSSPSCPEQESANAYVMLINIIKIKRKGWIPNWNDSGQYKYYAWFKMQTNSASGFSYDDYGYWLTLTYCGSRLCLPTRELAENVGKEFISIYEKHMAE